MIEHGDALNWEKILAQFPAVARLAKQTSATVSVVAVDHVARIECEHQRRHELVEPDQPFTAADYQRAAFDALHAIAAKHDLIITGSLEAQRGTYDLTYPPFQTRRFDLSSECQVPPPDSAPPSSSQTTARP